MVNDRKNTMEGHLYLRLFDGFVDFWEASLCLGEVGELAL